MSSGWSATSKKNVSHIYMQKYQECLATTPAEERIEKCLPIRDDYFESLHHKEEEYRMLRAQVERERKLAAMSREGHNNSGH